ncbi:hypothetical protein FAZ15_13820 [Sphingobacterium olei]|uniref:Uncharacterized protein n=1 Tax=Sphingobacterium olei TaxID=2571155 RepID=A0A4U0P0D6_9SPHI|nr:hypothetical protein [Sphingobacterium olei]TJZ59962.1 hypothetical protein FAZ15_13820 [Sphingobacterium olei]
MKNLIMGLMLVWISVPVRPLAQSDSTAVVLKKTTLTLSSVVSSNANYYGQTAQEALPFGYLDFRLRMPSGWYASSGGYQLLTEDNFPSELHLGTGFEFDITPNIALDLNYTRSFYAKDSPILQASNPNSASASIEFTHYFKTGLTGDFNFGKSEDIFLSLTNSKDIQLAQWGSNLLHLNPGINIVAGTQRFYVTYMEETSRRLLGGLLPIPLPGNGETVETTTVSEDFNLLSYNFNLPLVFYRGKSALMLSYQLSLLSKKTGQERSQNSFLSLGYFYQF